ncbi:MAG: glucokinase [Clostridiales bacterium]|jgi:glucokinase|nr:glucokinase [Clostridiales bacterium]MDK2992781.1 glucokinase [Clostridiales bacterium]
MLYVGVDLGGTKMAAGVVDDGGRILVRDTMPTGRERPFEVIAADMAKLILSVIQKGGYAIDDISGIGIGSPGAIDNTNGIVIFANNFGWHNVPLRSELQKYIDLPIYMENDATVAGLAESVYGAGKGVKNAITLTLGTGLGGGIIINGHIYSGSHHVGSELGHLIVEINGRQCTCGNRGCWEQYASATALITAGKEAVLKYPDSLILKFADGDPEKITAKTIEDAARAGDNVAAEVFDEYVYYLTMGIISIINAFDPEMIIIGGGVSGAGDFLLKPLTEKVKEHIFYKELDFADIRLAELGNDAGIIGAAMLATDKYFI